MATATEDIVIGVSVDTKDATKSLKGLEDRLEELTEKRKTIPIGTEGFNEISREIQGIETQLKNVDLQFEALDFEQKLTAGTDAVVGLAGGFMAAQGTMALMGSESETLEKAFTRMASALTITMGLRDLANGIIALRKFGIAQKVAAGATRIFNAALKANPIGAIIGLVMALVAAVAILIDAFKAFGEQSKTFQEEQLESMKKVEEQINRNLELAKKQAEVSQVAFSAFEEEAKAAIRVAKLHGKSGQELLDIEKGIADQRAKNTKEQFELANKELYASQERIKLKRQELLLNNQTTYSIEWMRDSEWEKHQTIVKNHDELVKQIKDEEINFKKLQEEKNLLRIKAVNDSKESRLLQAEFDKEQDEKARKRRKENNKKEVQDNSKSLQAQQNDLNAFYQAVEKIETDHFNSFKNEQEKEEQAVKDKFFNMIELAKRYGEDTAMLEEARQRQLQLIRRKYSLEELMERGETELEIQRLLEEARIQNIADETERAKAERQQEFNNETLDLLEQGMLTAELEKEMKKKLDSDLAELDKKAKEEQKQRTIDTINAGFQAAQNSINALSAINEASSLKRISEIDAQTQAQVQGLEEGDSRRKAIEEAAEKRKLEIQKKEFERGKKIQIAQAIISGLQGIVNIWSAASTIPQPADAIYRGVNTAALIATTAAQISKIKSTPFGGGGSVSGGESSASAGGIGAVPIGNISNTASLVDQQQQELTAQVVVLESDITTTQENVTAVSELSSF